MRAYQEIADNYVAAGAHHVGRPEQRPVRRRGVDRDHGSRLDADHAAIVEPACLL